MAHKDYVSRGRSAKKAAPPSKKIPWLRLCITLALVAGFSYFLWSIKDVAEIETAEQEAPQVVINDDPLPEMPKDKFGYPDWLKEFTVEIEEKEQQSSGKRYLMQCGSFRKETQANEMKARIALQGLYGQVRPSEGSNGIWYRVILGPYDTKRDAEKDRHTLRRAKMTTCKIWYWNL